MNYIRYQPLSLIRELQQELMPLFCLKEEAERPSGAALWAPEVDIIAQDNKLLVTMDVPGVEAKELNIEVKDNVLTVKGERKEEQIEKQPHYYKAERRGGKFLRQIPLPFKVDEAKIIARIKNGVLVIELPPLEAEADSRKIEIREE